ncbi:Mrp/NBP35 family ATP-binding protein [bacterium]|nr:Mrp/NBP35 family ATP-binding protein [bacterium]
MGCDHNCSSCSENCDERDLRVKANDYSFINKVIGVVSGKGGVGKSLVTSLLAVELNKKGYNVGILDADITGPSIPKAFGLKGMVKGSEIGIMPALTRDNIKVISTNLLLEDTSDPVVWRGPIIAGTVQQFYTDVVWDKIDVLLVDMPPGTGDVPLTVFQSLPVDGIVVVASPQELVSMIVEKALKMAKLMNISVLGLVENMSYFHCPDNNKDYKIFGDSHIDEIAKKHNLNVVAKLPIDPKIAELSDKGLIEDYNSNYLDDLIKKIESIEK